MSSKSLTGRFENLDFLKFIAIYFVLFYHLNNLPVDILLCNDTLVHFHYWSLTLFSACVPLFFFVNGALLMNKESIDIKMHMLKMLKLAALTIVWGVITIFVLAILRGEELNLLTILRYIFTLKLKWVNHLWFMEALFVVYFFYPLLHLAFAQKRPFYYFFLGAVIFFTIGNSSFSILLNFFNHYTSSWKSFDFRLNLFGQFNPFRGIYGFSIAYFMLGGVVFHYSYLLNKRRIVIIALAAIPICMSLLYGYGSMMSFKDGKIWDIVWNGYDTVFTLTIVLSIYVLSMNYKAKAFYGKIIHSVGENTLGIYFIHALIGEGFKQTYFDMEFSHNFIVNALYILLILLLSLLLALVIKKIPILNYLLMKM